MTKPKPVRKCNFCETILTPTGAPLTCPVCGARYFPTTWFPRGDKPA